MKSGVLSIPEAAEHCAVSRWTILKRVHSGELKASRTPGGHYRILREDLESFMREKGMYPLVGSFYSDKKILIVDDDLIIQETLSSMLAAHGYETDLASSGFEAGAKVVKFKPGLIILDLIMSGMDGFEVCERIKENPDTSQIKILAMTGYDTEDKREKIMKAGADGFIAKPIQMDDLLKRLDDLLKERPSLKKMKETL